MNQSMKVCPICGESYAEPSAVSRSDNKTLICSSCGIREALEPLRAAGVMSEAHVEDLVKKNKKMYTEAYDHACG